MVRARVDAAARLHHRFQPHHRWRVQKHAPAPQQMHSAELQTVHFTQCCPRCNLSSRMSNPISASSKERARGARLRQQREAAVGAVVQGGDEQAPLRLHHAVLAPLHLRSNRIWLTSQSHVLSACHLLCTAFHLRLAVLTPQHLRNYCIWLSSHPDMIFSLPTPMLCMHQACQHAQCTKLCACSIKSAHLHRVLQLQSSKDAAPRRPEARRGVQVRREQQLALHHVTRPVPRLRPPCSICDAVLPCML